MCNLTWWTLSEEPQREIPLQKVSSISHRSSQGKSLNIHTTLEQNQTPCDKLLYVSTVWVTSCVCCVCVCVWVCDAAGSEPSRRVKCGQGAGLCISAVRRSEEAPAPRVRESVFWSRFCCVNALLLVSINIFLYAYFAWVEEFTSCLLISCQSPDRNFRLCLPNSDWFLQT